jgi:hypothetical protein
MRLHAMHTAPSSRPGAEQSRTGRCGAAAPSEPQQSEHAAATKMDGLKWYSLQEALKFARHGKRTCMRSADINHALQLRDVDQMHGFCATDRRRYASLAGAPDVFYVEDTLRNCDDLIYEPLPQPPAEVGVLVHWFLVNGVKPRIPENAVSRELLERITSQVPVPALRKHLRPFGNDCTQCDDSMAPALATPCPARLQQWSGSCENDGPANLAAHVQAANGTSTAAGHSPAAMPASTVAQEAVSISPGSTQLQQLPAGGRQGIHQQVGREGRAQCIDGTTAVLDPVVQHIVSEEQIELMRVFSQVCFESAAAWFCSHAVMDEFMYEHEGVRDCIQAPCLTQHAVGVTHLTMQVLLAPTAEENLDDPIYATIAADSGLEQVVPYIVAHISAEVRTSRHSLVKMARLVQVAAALVLNRSNNLGGYLGQLLPAIMTCLLSAKLGPPRAPLLAFWPLPASHLPRLVRCLLSIGASLANDEP